MSVASAQCSINPDTGVPTNCTEASASNSGMFFGVDNGTLGTAIEMGSGKPLNDFGWNLQSNILMPTKSYNTLEFRFNDSINNTKNSIVGEAGQVGTGTNPYKITINTYNTGNKESIFLFNAGTNILRSNLNVVFDTELPNRDQYYYLNAGGLDGNLTLKNGGNFIANLTGSIAGKIDNAGSDATFYFTSPSKEKITLGDIEARLLDGSDGYNVLVFSNVEAEINGSIINGFFINDYVVPNNIILNSTKSATKLTLNGADTFVSLRAEGKNNTIIFNNNLKTYIWETLRENAKDNTKLTFINKITRSQSSYTASHLMVTGSCVDDRVNNFGIQNQKLNGTYQMKIQGDGTIKPEEIKESIKVATIKKHKEAGLGSPTGDEQADLRNQGVIDLGAKTLKTLTRTLEFKDFTYSVAETDRNGNINGNGQKDYITYFIGKDIPSESLPPEVETPPTEEEVGPTPTPNPTPNPELEFQQDVLSNIALSTTGLYLANFNSLNKRMGELRDNNHSQGIWARIFNGQQSNSIGLKSSANFVTVQAGYDYAFGFDGANNFTGFALSYSHSQSKFKDRATAILGSIEYFTSIDSLRSDLVEVALYNAYVADSGWYNDTVAKFSYLLNQMGISGSDDMGGSNKGDINTYAFILSNEVGYRFKLGGNKEWYIDPQAELGFGYFGGQDLKFKGNDYSLNNFGTMDSLLTLRGRVGASFGYDFKNFTSRENGLSAKLYLGVFGEFDYFNGGDVKFKTKGRNETAKRAINADARAVLNVGTNLEVKDATRIYVDFESSFGGKITTDYKINAGVRYSFGENANYKSSNAVQKDNEVKEAPIKLQEGEEEEGEE